MSAASEPVPRVKSPLDNRPTPSRHTLFLPVFVFLIGAGALALYQVLAMEDQLEQLTQSVDKMEDKVKRAQYEKSKFYHIAGDVVRLAAKDPTAEQIVVRYKLRQLQAAQPELMSENAPSDVGMLNANPASPTNSGAAVPPVKPSTGTDAAPTINGATPAIPSPAAK